jgi:hypothetical protein
VICSLSKMSPRWRTFRRGPIKFVCSVLKLRGGISSISQLILRPARQLLMNPSGIVRWTIVWSLKSISLLGFSVIQIHHLGNDSKRSNFLCISWQIFTSPSIAPTIMTEVETTPGSSSTEDPPPCTPCGIAASLPRPWMLTSAATLLHSRAPLQRRRPRFGVAAHWIGQTRVIGLRRGLIYKRLAGTDGVLPISYAADMLPIVNERLQRAGVRLAKILNAALAFPGLEGSRIDSPAPAK